LVALLRRRFKDRRRYQSGVLHPPFQSRACSSAAHHL
jgi:hypothetical protein